MEKCYSERAIAVNMRLRRTIRSCKCYRVGEKRQGRGESRSKVYTTPRDDGDDEIRDKSDIETGLLQPCPTPWRVGIPCCSQSTFVPLTVGSASTWNLGKGFRLTETFTGVSRSTPGSCTSHISAECHRRSGVDVSGAAENGNNMIYYARLPPGVCDSSDHSASARKLIHRIRRRFCLTCDSSASPDLSHVGSCL